MNALEEDRALEEAVRSMSVDPISWPEVAKFVIKNKWHAEYRKAQRSQEAIATAASVDQEFQELIQLLSEDF